MTNNYIESCECHGKRLYPFGGVSVRIQDNAITFVDYPWVKPAEPVDEENPNAWDGTSVEAPVFDEETMTYTLSTPANLAWLAENVEDTKDKTFVLDADIDLGGKAWPVIGTNTGTIKNNPDVKWFEGTFDGQGHTISNLSCEVVDDYAKAGLFGAFKGVVKNVKIEKAHIKSTHYAAAIFAYTTSGTDVVVENCEVMDSVIVTTPKQTDAGEWDNGDKAGGIAGYVNSACTIKNCKVKDTTITAYRDLGGLVGYISGTGTNVITLIDNTVEGVKLVQDYTNGYKTVDEVKEHHGDFYGWNDGKNAPVESGNAGTVEYEAVNMPEVVTE